MITLNKQYVAEISELIKNLMNFCKYKVQVNTDEISLLCFSLWALRFKKNEMLL